MRSYNESKPTPTLLMCAPRFFDCNHFFNPWMKWQEEINLDRVLLEWEGLYQLIKDSGAKVEMIEQHDNASAMVFTRDAALAYDKDKVLILRNDGYRGGVEQPIFRHWFKTHGYESESLPPAYNLDGGNIVRLHNGNYLIGMKPGADGKAERYLGRLLNLTTKSSCVGIPLNNRKFLHLDMVIADLNGRGWLIYPEGIGDINLDNPAWQDVFGDVPIIEVTEAEATKLACNIIIINDIVIGSYFSPRLIKAITKLNFEVGETTLDEFRKAGGGAHCLTLEVSGPDLSKK